MTGAGGSGDEWASHPLLLYWDAAQRHDTAAMWIERGIDRDEKILCAEPPGDDGLLQGLSVRGVDVSAALQRGQVSMLTFDDLYPPDGQAALVRRARDEGFAGLRLSVQANAALDHLGSEWYRAVHRGLDELDGVLPVSALCQYDVRQHSAETLEVVIDTHPEAVEDPQMRARRGGGGIVLAGEVDFASAHVLASWLGRAWERTQGSEVVLELSGLTFIDVAGCRALVSGTDGFRSQDGVVFLHGMSGHIRKVMTLLGLDHQRGVAMA